MKFILMKKNLLPKATTCVYQKLIINEENFVLIKSVNFTGPKRTKESMFIKHSLKLFRDSLQVYYLPNQKRRLRRAQKTMIFILSNILFIFTACGAWATFRTSDKNVVSYFAKKGLNAQIHFTKFQGH